MCDHLEENASIAYKDAFNTTTLNLSDDSSSYYYLHPSDNPGAPVKIILRGVEP